MQGKLTKKECAIIHDAMHLADLHNMEEQDQNIAMRWVNKKDHIYEAYTSKDVWKILQKMVRGMKGGR